MKPIAFAFAFLLLPLPPAWAQQSGAGEGSMLPHPRVGQTPLHFDRIDLDDGLSQGTVYTMLQDGRGFMWFGTQDGLNRFDGHAFEVYKPIPFDSTSLSDNHILALHEDRSGTLWIGTSEGGLNRFDRTTETFTSFQHEPDDSTSLTAGTIQAIEESADGMLWVGTQRGLNRLDPSTRQVTRFVHVPGDSTSLSNNIVYEIHEGADGYLWVNTGNGLNRLDPESGTFRRYLSVEGGNPNAQAQEAAGIISFAFLEDPSDPEMAWLSTGSGFVHFNKATGAHERFVPDPEDPEANIIIDAVPDPHDEGVYWLTGFGSGLYRFDSRTKTFELYSHDPSDPASLSSNLLFQLYADRSGTLWAGTMSADGVNRFTPAGSGFTLYGHAPDDSNSLPTDVHVFGLYVAPSDPDVVWMGATQETINQPGALYRLDRRTGTLTSFRHDPDDRSSIGPGTPRVMLEDHTGTFWVGTARGGLCRMDRRRETFDCLRHEPSDSTSLASNSIGSLFEDGSGTLWVGTFGGGLHRFHRETNNFTRFQHDPADTSSIGSDVVYAILQDQQGLLWIGTRDGLERFDPSTETFEHFDHDPRDPSTLSHHIVNTLLERPQEPGVLWLGTAGGGLNRFHAESGTFTHFTEWNSDLPNSFVYGILSDDEGRLWISTNNGLARFDPETQHFRTFDRDAGLQGREFNQFAFAKSRTGELLFGGTYGVNVFHPDQLAPNPTPPQVAITAFRLFNKPVEVRADGPLQQPLNETEEIRLAHWQKTLSFDFVGLHYKNPAKNEYAYRLDGFDEEWIDAGTQRTATYTNLDPDTYTFRVRAANSDGVWNEEGAAVQLTILPPWWQTWWFRLLALGTIVGLAYGGYRARVARIRAQNRRLEADVEARTEELRRKNDVLEKSHAIVQALNAEMHFEALLHTVLKQTTVIPGVEKATALVHDDTTDTYQVRASIGWDVDRIGDIRLTPEDAEARYVRHAEEVASDIFVEKHVDERPGNERLAGLGVPASLLVMRVQTAQRTEGYLVFDNMRDRDAFEDRDVALLEHLRAHIVSAFVKTRLLERLRQSLDELKQMQTQLVQQEKLASLGQLTAGIAHEIKNPLNFVNNFAQLTAELVDELGEELGDADGRLPETTREEIAFILEDLRLNAQKIEEHGRRADGIVKSMLEHSRGGKGEREAVEVNALVEEYVGLSYHGMRASNPNFNSAIERDYDESAGEAAMLPQEIGRVVINLLNNAFYAVHERSRQEPDYQPKVRVATRRTKDAVTVEVADNGPGIPEHIREKVFEPFFTTKPTGDGTGLGLSMSYDIVTQGHGGTMTVETTEGEGTTFRLSLPDGARPPAIPDTKHNNF